MDTMNDYSTTRAKESLRHLSSSPFLIRAVKQLTEDIPAINTELSETVLGEIPAFSESRNPEVLPDFANHSTQHTTEILRLLGGGMVGDFEFVRDYARKRAEQRFPLEAILHAYRCGHKVFSRWVRKAILTTEISAENTQQIVTDVADFAFEYTDAISTIAASTYVSQVRLLSDIAGDQRTELLSILLSGYDESDRRVTKILHDAGYLKQRQSFCVVLAQSVDPAEMLNLARARRMVDSIDSIFQKSSAHRLIDLHHNKVTIIFSDIRRTSGWTAPHTALAERISSELLMVGNAALIGVSNDVPSTSQIPNAYREASLALDLADLSQRVVQFSQIPAQRLLLHIAGEEFQRTLPTWAKPFFHADDVAGGTLVTTLRAYANANMNILKTAQNLSVHPNTIYSRLQKILDITSMDARRYYALTELLIIADCKMSPRGTRPNEAIARPDVTTT